MILKIVSTLIIAYGAIFCLGTNPAFVYSQTSLPNISDHLAILQVTDQYKDFDDPLILRKLSQFEEIEMSSSGRFIVGRTRVTEESGRLVLSNLYIWDTYEFDFEDNVVFPEPYASLSLDETTYTKDFAISPDEQYIALRTETSVKLLTIRDLVVVNEIPASRTISREFTFAYAPNNKIAWSHESNTLAILIENETSLLFWDINSEQISIVPLNIERYPDWQTTPQTRITSTEQGWIIHDFYEQPDVAFVFCDIDKNCTTYRLEGIPNTENVLYKMTTVSSLSGRLVVSASSAFVDNLFDEDGSRMIIWKFSNGEYHPEEIFPRAQYPYLPLTLSPSGKYLYYSNLSDSENAILDLNTVDVLQTLGFSPTWIFNETYIGWLDRNLVFHIEDVITGMDIDSIDFTQVDNIDQNELLFNDEAFVRDISNDGRQILITLGGVASLVYIEQ